MISQLITMSFFVATALSGSPLPQVSFEDYASNLPLPNDATNGSTLLRLPRLLTFAILNEPPPSVLVNATQRYSDLIFAWGAPTVPSSADAPSLTRVEITVDDADDGFETLQLGAQFPVGHLDWLLPDARRRRVRGVGEHV